MRRTLAFALAVVAVALLVGLPGFPTLGSRPGGAAVRAAERPNAVVSAIGGAAPRVPAVGGASARMIVTTSDPTVVPNDGVGTNLTAYPLPALPASSSFQTGAEEVIGGYDAVFGLFANSATAPVAFFEVFSNTTDQQIQLEYWVALPIVPGAPYDFRLELLAGTTWELRVNQVPFGGNVTSADFDFGASSATWAGGVGYSEIAIYASTSTVPASYLATTALYVHHPSSGWTLPTAGRVSYSGPSQGAWGVEGRSSLPELAPGEVESGTVLAPVPTNATLWTSGPVAVDVAVVVGASIVTSLSPVDVTANVSAPGGAALAGVPVYVHDGLGGSASPSTVLTGTAGASTTLLLAPNVTANAADAVFAVVTILGYQGASSGSVVVTPAAEVVVVAEPGSFRIAPGGVGAVVLRTLDGAGRAAPDVSLAIDAVVYSSAAPGAGGGIVPDPSAGTSDANGTLAVAVTAPDVRGTFGLLVNVTSLGAWGHATVRVTVEPAPPSLWQRYGTTIEEAAVGAAVVAVVALLVFRYRRRKAARAPLPEMDLRSMRLRPPSPDSPVSRTPPSGGTP